MVSVSDGCLQGKDSCLELLIDQTPQSPGGETWEDEGRKGGKGEIEKGRYVKGDISVDKGKRDDGDEDRESNSPKGNKICEGD